MFKKIFRFLFRSRKASERNLVDEKAEASLEE